VSHPRSAPGARCSRRSRGAPGAWVPDRTVALTFEDGPSAWTPRVLAVLERYRVPATFFIIGENVAAHAELLRRMIHDGDEIGVHTFTHPDLAGLPPWQERLELDQTQLAIAAATGYTTNLLRPPYSSVPAALDSGTWRAITHADNYRVALADLDTRDWARPGVNAIVRAATPRSTHGAVIMLHDGRGDRSQTVTAVARLVPALSARGYRFVTVSQAAGQTPPWHQASFSQRARGSALIFAVLAAGWFTHLLWWRSLSPVRCLWPGWAYFSCSPGGTAAAIASHCGIYRPYRSSCLPTTSAPASWPRYVHSPPATTPWSRWSWSTTASPTAPPSWPSRLPSRTFE
jgi:peptidoglycan/xylan/chitin deacetylase (PgdA/CDA1 family)